MLILKYLAKLYSITSLGFLHKNNQKIFGLLKKKYVSLILSFLIIFVISGNFKSSIISPNTDELNLLPLEKYQRVIIFAPHNDDETLAAAGVIRKALLNGSSIQVVIATNGDGSISTALSEFRKIYPTPSDYIWIGNVRQQESLVALQTFGLSTHDIEFLSYPDRGISYLWENYWNCDRPFHSPFTNSTSSKYLITYNTESQYCGYDLFRDLKEIITRYQPDLIIYPSVHDEHPDHWGLANFINLTVKVLQLNDQQLKPDMYQYLVHRYGFPNPKGYYPDLSLAPPPSLFDVSENWVKVNLENDDVFIKNRAIQSYKSQMLTLKSFLSSFDRRNELFAKAQHWVIKNGQAEDPFDPNTWKDLLGNELMPLIIDPIKDNIRREYISSGDIEQIYTVIEDHKLFICAQLRGMPRAYNTYTVRFRSYDNGEFFYNLLSTSRDGVEGKLQRNHNNVCGSIPLLDLGNPELLMLEFDVKTGNLATIDRTAWAIVLMDEIQ